ncbi:hypothetical protein RBB77_18715 [Tunturibacter psychrotolerans]|uniref:Uncharacterized protein n=1 Tax=Tunturiibacter psychrotolerans TaxID=3069686 RepID=A0AAU7ZND8_9BACT
MIGVIANAAEHNVIVEFFELFKTPWEFYRGGRRYDVLLCAGDSNFDGDTARLILIYASGNSTFDGGQIESTSRRSKTTLLHNGSRIPIYGDSTTFREEVSRLLVDEESQQTVIHQHQSCMGLVVRLGYDLFSEVGILLTAGQPAAYAAIPTLDLHIALLRDLIVASGVPLIEIPPVPEGYRFVACLTHDVDHPSIRRHKWDHTMFGFLYRAIVGSWVNFFRGRIGVRALLKNWTAALKLPFVFMGYAKDFWSSFDDRYFELEKGLPSTFFIIPFKDEPGRNSGGLAPAFRAARYGAQDIADTIEKIVSAGCEVGLHGIDAWIDSTNGKKELEEIRRLTGESHIGVRMHWLYYDQQSASALESAEASYDSTVGYKETVGYHAGTTQAYKPLQVNRLLELPMHAMDTALFYPAYMGLSQRQAAEILRQLTDNVSDLGGCITINWHDRSLVSERLWDACYRSLIQDLKDRKAWFATAGQAVAWFRKRRSVVFDIDGSKPNAVRAKVTAHHRNSGPDLRLRIYSPQESNENGAHRSEKYVDIIFNENINVPVSCGVAIE